MAGRSDRHSSRSAVARALKQPTRKAWAGPASFPTWSCSGRGMPSMSRRRDIWWALAPPFHPYHAWRGGLLSVALSEGRPSWVLPSVLPCGARTFLPGPWACARARSDGLSGSRARPCWRRGRCASTAIRPQLLPAPPLQPPQRRRPWRVRRALAWPPQNVRTRRSGAGSWGSSGSAGPAGGR